MRTERRQSRPDDPRATRAWRAREFAKSGAAFMAWAFVLSAVAMAPLAQIAILAPGYGERPWGRGHAMHWNYGSRGLALAIGLSAAFLLRKRLTLEGRARRWKIVLVGALLTVTGVVAWDYLRCDLPAFPPIHVDRVAAEWARAREQLPRGHRPGAQVASEVAGRLEGVEWTSRGWRHRIVTLGGDGVEGQRWYPLPGGAVRVLPRSGPSDRSPVEDRTVSMLVIVQPRSLGARLHALRLDPLRTFTPWRSVSVVATDSSDAEDVPDADHPPWHLSMRRLGVPDGGYWTARARGVRYLLHLANLDDPEDEFYFAILKDAEHHRVRAFAVGRFVVTRDGSSFGLSLFPVGRDVGSGSINVDGIAVGDRLRFTRPLHDDHGLIPPDLVLERCFGQVDEKEAKLRDYVRGVVRVPESDR